MNSSRLLGVGTFSYVLLSLLAHHNFIWGKRCSSIEYYGALKSDVFCYLLAEGDNVQPSATLQQPQPALDVSSSSEGHLEVSSAFLSSFSCKGKEHKKRVSLTLIEQFAHFDTWAFFVSNRGKSKTENARAAQVEQNLIVQHFDNQPCAVSSSVWLEV